LELKVRNRLPSSTSLKQLGDVLQEEWYKILLETVQNLYESIPNRTEAALKGKVIENHISKEKCTVFLVLPLFCPTPIGV
jgi:hypothetical protein